MNNDVNSQKSDKKPLFILVLLISMVISSIVCFYNYEPLRVRIHNLLFGYNLIPKIEKFTELFFQKYPVVLSKDVVRGGVVDFSFTVHNFEGRDMEYKYYVYYNADSGVKTLIDKNTLSIKDGDAMTVMNYYAFKSDNDTGNITVSLPDSKQEITFYLPTKEQ